MNIAIVGAGLFGSVIGRVAQGMGHQVYWIDDLRPLSGSEPSAGLIKPTWLDGFGAPAKVGLSVIDNLVGLETIKFRFNGVANVDVHHVNPFKLLVRNDPYLIRAEVTGVGDGWVRYIKPHGELEHHNFDRVVVAAGWWTSKLLVMPRVDALKGTAFYFCGQVPEAYMSLWAPFKQLKVFNRPGNEIWTGDSTGMSPKTYTPARKEASYQRCQTAVSTLLGYVPLLSREVSGLRPVVPGYKLGYFAPLSPKLYVSTGGGKMGTVLAGWHAHLFRDALTNG